MTEKSFPRQVERPGRYLGNEFNSTRKSWHEISVRGALVFPDLYEIGMSHQGLQILYHIINAERDALAERCYCPDIDAERLLRQSAAPLVSLESGRALADFDFVGVTLPYELCDGNILTILDLAGIPFYAAERDERFPLILGGGAGAFNPEPVADFFDAILLGDGEEAILDIVRLLVEHKKQPCAKATLLRRLAAIDGIYVPSLFVEKAGTLQPLDQSVRLPRRRILPKLDQCRHLLKPLVPNTKIVHDRLGLEIARGCARGCRFCQAGTTYRPVRERDPEQIMTMAEEGIANSGFEELALLSLSTGDYSCLPQLFPRLVDRFAESFVGVSLPSMRVGTLTPEIMEQIRRVRKTGFTLAPEAGSERLRLAINKGITEEDLVATCQAAFALGWQGVKLYFMIGLPGETADDIQAIIDLCRRIRLASGAFGGGKKNVSISVGVFVPKAHTPFQWHGQLGIDEGRERITFLRGHLPKGVSIKWQIPEQSFLEGVLARGDRSLAKLIETAWRMGARLDGWSEHFRLATWREAAARLGMVLEDYLRPRPLEAPLPWSHLDCGVTTEFLLRERQNSEQHIYTPDCRYHGCQACGVCDFKTIAPVVYDKEAAAGKSLPVTVPESAKEEARTEKRRPPTRPDQEHHKYLISYRRVGAIAFLGHLDMLQIIFRSLRRAGIETNFSEGFNPSPKVSFSPALPVGTESECEYFLVDSPRPLPHSEEILARLNAALPPGLAATAISRHPGRVPQSIVCDYEITGVAPLEDYADSLTKFIDATSRMVERERKGKTRLVDIRPLVAACAVDGEVIRLTLNYHGGESGVKPLEALAEIFALPPQRLTAARTRKIAWRPLPAMV
ncbi:MAG: TIGR03960 family B12-binding radical SAM protein [Desulfobulbaceae bacterium]|nr:TIGR03960 family B12-binding radical SAM protein [Desulfobulbaceae bacterium]